MYSDVSHIICILSKHSNFHHFYMSIVYPLEIEKIRKTGVILNLSLNEILFYFFYYCQELI